MSAAADLAVVGPDAGDGGATGSATRVAEAAHRAVDVLVQGAVVDADAAPTWPSWTLGSDGRPEAVVGGRRSVYSGDAGVVWALTEAGAALDRADATDLAAAGRSAIARRAPDPGEGDGLLVGGAGVALLAGGGGEELSPSAWSEGTDLTDGLAGILLGRALGHDPGEAPGAGPEARHAARVVAELRRRSHPAPWGRCWPDPRLDGADARPLCGLAHGASGIVWALAEAAAAWPGLGDEALDLAAEGLRWEAAWIDPVQGGWPDLREGEVSWPDLWCHGSVGAGAVRLRLIELAERGLEVPWSLDVTRAEAEMAVQRCGAELSRSAAVVAEAGPDALVAGISLCHGAGGQLALLALAADVLGVPEHREAATEAAGVLLAALPEDPGEWPCGMLGADGDLSLLNGVAGTAVVLADLARPGRAASPALLGAGGRRRPR